MRLRPESRLDVALAAAGFLATAVAFGPARMGFGLFMPVFRDSFGLSTGTAGLVASIAFGAFLLALLATAWLAARTAPRIPLVLGGIAASAGLSLVAMAGNTFLLTAGVVLAAASAGFSWTPYNSTAERMLSGGRRGRILSIVSTGTTFGVAAAGVLAFAIYFHGFSWRVSWAIFAGAAILSLLVNALTVCRMRESRGPEAPPASYRSLPRSVRDLLVAEAAPMYMLASSFGLTNAIYLSFAVDHVTAQGGLPGVEPLASGPVIYTAFGVAGVVGVLARQIEGRIGLETLMRSIFAVSAVSLSLIALAPGSWAGVLVSAGLQGACLMILSAALSFWSARLFHDLPSTGFTAAVLCVAAGNMLGPLAAGMLANIWGFGSVFAGAAAISLLTAALFPGRPVRHASAAA